MQPPQPALSIGPTLATPATRIKWPRIRSTLNIVTMLCVLPGTMLCPVTCRSADIALYDLVIYGGTSAGISAAVQAKRMGATVIVLEPSSRIGGLTTSGLGQTDIGNKAAIGGISREFYQRVRKYYAEDSNWNWETKASYRSGGQSRTTAGKTPCGHSSHPRH